MTIVGLLCLGAVFGAIIAGPWWWRAAHAEGYHKGINDANALICGEISNVENR